MSPIHLQFHYVEEWWCLYLYQNQKYLIILLALVLPHLPRGNPHWISPYNSTLWMDHILKFRICDCKLLVVVHIVYLMVLWSPLHTSIQANSVRISGVTSISSTSLGRALSHCLPSSFLLSLLCHQPDNSVGCNWYRKEHKISGPNANGYSLYFAIIL